VGAFRVARRACLGGAADGRSCTADGDCPGPTCSAPLFAFSDRYDAGVGPILIADTQYSVGAESPVPLDGLFETPDAFAFAVAEGLAANVGLVLQLFVLRRYWHRDLHLGA
jgi:hypothetical protein